MKLNLFTCLLLFTTCSNLMAQERKADDALLLDYYQNQRFADALTYLKTVYPEPVNDAKELSRLAYTSSMASKLPDAEAYYQRIYAKDSTNKSVLYNLASLNMRRGNNGRAELYYKKLVAIDTTNFSAYNRLALICRDKADVKNEILYFEKANTINPADADVAADLSDLYIQFSQEPKAEKILRVAIAADVDNIILQQTLLKLNYVQSKWQQTQKTGEQLLLLGDSSTNTINKLGRAYYQTRNYICGIAVLTKIPEAERTETSAYLTAICYKQLRDQKNAILFLNKAIELSLPANIDVYYNEVADSYETLKQFKKAQDSYQKGLLYNDKALTYYFLATLFDTDLKDKKSALKYYKKYIAGKPDKAQQSYMTYSAARIVALGGK